MQGRVVVAVAGTHGKTTTTSLLTVALQHCGADPSFAIGGDLNETGSNAHDGSGELFVAEADESDGAFLVYSPHAALVTNVEADHLDNYGTDEAYRAAFDTFVDRVSPDGFMVVCADDPGADDAGPYGGRAGPGRRTGGGERRRRGPGRGRALPRARRRPSRSSTAAAASARSPCRSPAATTSSTRSPRWPAACGSGSASPTSPAGWPPSAAPGGGWSSRARSDGVRVYDSYAHHPNEIVGDLQAARSLAGEGRVVVAFQPHMVSRTRIFGHDMGVALGAADDVVVMDIYVAREDPEPGVTGALVADAVPLDPAHVVFERVVVGGRGPPRRAGPPRRRRAHPRRRRRHPARARGARAARESGVPPMSMRERLRRKKADPPVAAAGRAPALGRPRRGDRADRPQGLPAPAQRRPLAPASAWSCSRSCWWPPCRPRCGWCSSPAT